MSAGFATRVGDWSKQALRTVAPPALFLSLVAYFVWNVTQGDRGWQATKLREEQLIAVQDELNKVQTEQGAWERRVNELRSQHIDPDMLDERARAMLNLADPNDIVVPYGQNQRLFNPP